MELRPSAKMTVEIFMVRNTILYISDEATSGDSPLAALEATGYDVVSANRSTQAIALLFVMHSAAAVVLNLRKEEEASFGLARSLQAICPNVPIFLLCDDQIDRLPPGVEACLPPGKPLENLASEVRRLLTAKRIAAGPVHCGKAA